MVCEPLSQSKVNLSRTKDTFERIHENLSSLWKMIFMETLAFVCHASGSSED